jgi:DNA replication protein DnaC
MDIHTTLDMHLRELRLPAIRELYREFSDKAEQEVLGYKQFLYELVSHEIEVRKTNRIERFLRESKIPLEKTFEVFDTERLPPTLLFQVKNLLHGEFLDRKENILAFGNPGSGKTHLLCAIGQKLIYQEKRIYFTTCNMLVQKLLRAKRELRLEKAIKRYSKYDSVT